jgi:uncharacterized phiE125 gp8 family phage protein
MSLTLVTAPAQEPVSLSVAKKHLRVDHADEDALIAGYIAVARHQAETATWRALLTQTWDLKLDHFPVLRDYFDGCSKINLPKARCQSVTYIHYVDTAGDTQTLATTEYTADTGSEPARIVPAYGKSWPSTRGVINAVTVRFVAGYGDDPSDVPEPIRQAMLLMVGHLYERREATIVGQQVYDVPMGWDALLAPYRVWGF